MVVVALEEVKWVVGLRWECLLWICQWSVEYRVCVVVCEVVRAWGREVKWWW